MLVIVFNDFFQEELKAGQVSILVALGQLLHHLLVIVNILEHLSEILFVIGHLREQLEHFLVLGHLLHGFPIPRQLVVLDLSQSSLHEVRHQGLPFFVIRVISLLS